MTPRFALAVGLAVAATAGCTVLAGLDGVYVRADAGPPDAEAIAADARPAPAVDAAPATDGPASPDARVADPPAGPPLVTVLGGTGVGALEVSRRQYAAWLATSPATSGQPTACAWNTTFAPDETCAQRACAGLGCPEHPQVCVDWCDARAFCDAIGQRLCGRIGGGGEAPDEHADVKASQWFAACSEGGRQAFPYGNGYHVAYCNGGDNQDTGCVDGGACQTVITGASPRCIAEAPDGGKVFDLSGNAWEWTDACTDAPDAGARDAACRIRGGSYRILGDARVRCAGDPALDRAARGTIADDVGFRCCAK